MMKKICLLLIVMMMLLSACSAASPRSSTATTAPLPSTSTATVQPSPAEPTATEWPTMRILPTWTPIPTSTPRPTSQADEFAFSQLKRLGRGVNLGNALEAPSEGAWGVTLQDAYFDLISGAGFQSVRVPISWTSHASKTAPYTIDPAFFDRVDWVIARALQRNLAVILDFHNFGEEINTQPDENKDRFMGIWQQVAEHYATQPDSVYFELLNEPYDVLGKTDTWNKFINEAIKIIRRSNPSRTIIVGPGEWYSIAMLDYLRLPDKDRNLIVSFHYYSPFQFTHQGAEWVADSNPWLGTTWDGTDAEKSAIGKDFDEALAWGQENARPMYLGEFGAYSKAPMDSRERWTAFVAREAERRGFAWAYWEFCAGFGVYDPAKNAWNDPIKQALIP